jgi:ubiquinone/menaquinone biosynthesis C-methylase UbiE
MTREAFEPRRDSIADVRSYFERAAGSFDRLYSEKEQTPFWRWINRKFRSDIVGRFLRTCEHVRDSRAKSVLDVGCGSGRYLDAFAEMGVERLVGIDLSQPMLDLAGERLRAGGHRNAELVRADFEQFTTDERFDVVVAMGFFDYQSNHVGVLKRMRLLARHSVIASFPRRHWFRTPLRRFRYWLKRCPVHFYDDPAVRMMGTQAGFAAVETMRLPGAGMDIVTVFSVNPC